MECNYADDEAPFKGDPIDPDEDTTPATGPNPGSDAAVKAGCICAVLDNAHGDPAAAKARGGYWITAGCKLHAPLFPRHGPNTYDTGYGSNPQRRDDIRDEDEGKDWT